MLIPETPGKGQVPAKPEARWAIAWLLAVGVLVNYVDRVNVSVAHDALFHEFALTDVTFGYLSAAYNWTYGLCQLPVGVLLDRFGVRRVGRASTFLWSIASFGAAFAPSLRSLFAARLLLGVGEAPIFPANSKAVGQWFPAQERSLPSSMFDAAAKLAPALGVPLLGVLLLRIGWRWSFAATGLLSFGYFALFWLVYRDPPGGAAGQQAAAPASAEDRGAREGVLLGYLMRQRKVLGLAIGFGSYNYTFYLLLVWLPRYLSSALHVDLLHSFLYTGVPWLFATVTDVVVGGWLPDWLIQRGAAASRVRRAVLMGGTACGLGLLGAARAHTPAHALLWISLSIGGLAAAAPVGWSIVTLIAPENSAGTVGGIINFVSQISAISASIVTGYLVEAHHDFALAFAVAALYLVAGLAAYGFLLGPIEAVPSPNYASGDGRLRR